MPILHLDKRGNMFNPYLIDFNMMVHGPGDHYTREKLVKQYAWAVPNRHAIEAIKALNTGVVELGAGSGYWAKLLHDNNVDIVAIDYKRGQFKFDKKWFDVIRGSSEKIKDYANRALMLCWPDYASKFASDSLIEYMYRKGQTLIYIGEPESGCTGNDLFHKIKSEDWNLKETVNIPQWFSIHDSLYIYKRK